MKKLIPFLLLMMAMGTRATYWSVTPSTGATGGTFNYPTHQKGPYPYIDVRTYGAIPNDGIDDTAAIQAAITAAEPSGAKVRFEGGDYNLSATLSISTNAAAGLGLVGFGKIKTRFYRTGDYGNTLVIGSTQSVPLDSITIENIWFYHYYGGYENGLSTTTMVNKPTAGAHLVAQGLTRVRISHCMFWNMPTQVDWLGGSEATIEDNNFRGVYDSSSTKSRLQISTQDILLEAHALGQVPTSIWLVNNKFTGYLSESRSVTYGTATVTQSENIGAQYGVRIIAGEDIQIRGGENGGHNHSGIMVSAAAGVSLLNIGISGGIMFDGNRVAAINFQNNNSAQTAYNVEIVGNVFNGQNNSQYAITAGTAGNTLQSVTAMTISGNNFLAYADGEISLNNAQGISVSGNILRTWNSAGGNFSDTNAGTGIYVGADSKHIQLTGNTLGGGNLFEAYNGTGTNNCKWGIFYSPSATDVNLSNNVNFGANTLSASF